MEPWGTPKEAWHLADRQPEIETWIEVTMTKLAEDVERKVQGGKTINKKELVQHRVEGLFKIQEIPSVRM